MTSRRATYALAVLTLVNFINYLDRYVVSGVLPKVEKTFGLDHDQVSWLFLVFMVVYMCSSPLGGYLGDRIPRRFVVAGSVFLWSLATIGSGLASSFGMLLVFRALTGVGEAGYGVVAPAIVSDLFERRKRTRMLSIFYTAMPLGAAAGFLVGGAVSDAHSWQMAFFVGGAPGILLAALALFTPEPVRGAMDEAAAPTQVRPSLRQSLGALWGNGRFWVSTAGLTLMTFSIGGLAAFMPTFLETERGMSGTRAGLVMGAITATSGLLGTVVGGIASDRLERRWPDAGVVLSGVGLVMAAPLMLAVARLHQPGWLFAALFATQFLIFLNTGPLNAAVLNCVAPGERAFAMGVSTLCLHLLGDAISPKVIGWIGARSSLADAITANALPVLLGGMVLLWGVRQASRVAPAGAR